MFQHGEDGASYSAKKTVRAITVFSLRRKLFIFQPCFHSVLRQDTGRFSNTRNGNFKVFSVINIPPLPTTPGRKETLNVDRLHDREAIQSLCVHEK